MSRTNMRALPLLLFSYLPFDAFYAFVSALELEYPWNIIMILHSCAKQIMTMCRVQE